MTVEIGRYRPEDRPGAEALYRRVFGADAATANRQRWAWQYEDNPSNPSATPEIWVARDGGTVVGQYGTMPVQLLVHQTPVAGSWGMDVMVAPERQREGLGERLFRTWDTHVGVSLGLGLSESSYRLFGKLGWPDVGPLPCFVKPLTTRAVARSGWPDPANRALSALVLGLVRVLGHPPADAGELNLLDRFDEGVTRLWERVSPKLDLAVRRDAAYLNWRFVAARHARYAIVGLRRGGEMIGYAVYRHVREAEARATLLVDFLVDPDDAPALRAILGAIDRAARRVGSDKIRCFAMHAGYGRGLRRAGYFRAPSTLEFVIKVNAFVPPPDLYSRTTGWHVTLGDSDQDR